MWWDSTSGSESEREVGEAGDDASGSCVGEAFSGAGLGRVADGLCACVLGGVDAGHGGGYERALGRGRTEGADAVFYQVGAWLEVTGWVARSGGDVPDLVGEAV